MTTDLSPLKSKPTVDWDAYWQRATQKTHHGVYEHLAEFYRKQLLSRFAAHVLSPYVRNEPGRQYLHAG